MYSYVYSKRKSTQIQIDGVGKVQHVCVCSDGRVRGKELKGRTTTLRCIKITFV